MTDQSEEMERILAPMLKKRLFVVISRAVVTQEQMAPHVIEHLEYMNRMETEGKLFASGPFCHEGVVVGDGLTIFQADTLEEAKGLIDAEPMTRLGFRTYELRPWELREGRITITLDASTSSYRF